jgi:hypothetical protein
LQFFRHSRQFGGACRSENNLKHSWERFKG